MKGGLIVVNGLPNTNHMCCALIDCKFNLHNTDMLESAFCKAIKFAGGHIKGRILIEKFPNGGSTGHATLEESNADWHTYQEHNNILIVDILTCGNECNPKDIINKLRIYLGCLKVADVPIQKYESEVLCA